MCCDVTDGQSFHFKHGDEVVYLYFILNPDLLEKIA